MFASEFSRPHSVSGGVVGGRACVPRPSHWSHSRGWKESESFLTPLDNVRAPPCACGWFDATRLAPCGPPSVCSRDASLLSPALAQSSLGRRSTAHRAGRADQLHPQAQNAAHRLLPFPHCLNCWAWKFFGRFSFTSGRYSRRMRARKKTIGQELKSRITHYEQT